MDLVAAVQCYQPKDPSGLIESSIAGRYIHSTTGDAAAKPFQIEGSKPLTIAAGEQAAVPCYEYTDLPTKEAPSGLHKNVPANDVFIIFDQILPENTGSGPHFYNTN